MCIGARCAQSQPAAEEAATGIAQVVGETLR
jgi:hypothetical protein